MIWPLARVVSPAMQWLAGARRFVLSGLVLFVALASGCRMGVNYPDLTGPRYGGNAPGAASGGDTLRIVSFNVAYGERVEEAIEILTTEAALADADVVLLQEMDGDGVARVARALGMGYRYYPAVRHRRTGRDLGNAVLSKWRIIEDEKLILPHRALFTRTQRIATAATVLIDGTEVRVYSVHLGTLLELNDMQRRRQLEMVLKDAMDYPRVIIGGDFNDGRVARVARGHGYEWPSAGIPRTHFWGRFDHVLARGLGVPDGAAGTITDVGGVSDHKPIWALVVLPARVPEDSAARPSDGRNGPRRDVERAGAGVQGRREG